VTSHTYPGDYRSAIARAKKVLTKAGFPWSTTTGRYAPYGSEQVTTDGVRVSRVGVSETVALHVHSAGWLSGGAKEEYRLINALAIATLREAGLPFDDRGWLACGRDAKRAQRTP